MPPTSRGLGRPDDHAGPTARSSPPSYRRRHRGVEGGDAIRELESPGPRAPDTAGEPSAPVAALDQLSSNPASPWPTVTIPARRRGSTHADRRQLNGLGNPASQAHRGPSPAAGPQHHQQARHLRENAKGRPACLTDHGPMRSGVRPGLSAELGMPTASIYNWNLTTAAGSPARPHPWAGTGSSTTADKQADARAPRAHVTAPPGYYKPTKTLLPSGPTPAEKKNREPGRSTMMATL